MSEVLSFKDSLINSFGRFEKELNGLSGKPVHRLRKTAIDYFEQAEYPNTKNEEWRYTNISPLLKHQFNPVPEAARLDIGEIEKFLFNGSFKYRLVFVNGRFSSELSALENLPDGIIVKNLAEAFSENSAAIKKYFGKYAAAENQIFTALNTAYTHDGAFIEVKKNKVIEEPVHLLFLSGNKEDKVLAQPRNLFIAGDNSQATVFEHYVPLEDSVYFTNAVTEAVIGKNAYFDHVKLQEESLKAFHFYRLEVDQELASNFVSHSISLGGLLSRNDMNSVFNDTGGECTLNGLFMLDGEQLCDTHTLIDHAKPHCNSHEHYKGVLDGSSRGVFNGKVIVRQDAQKTNAFQENNNIILSNEALVNTKPQLEIFADDVKCSHGATIGQLDKDAMFYLKSRGIGDDIGRGILLHAFASDVVRTIKLQPFKDYVEDILTRRFNQ